MSSKRELLRRQRRWARATGIEPNARGFVATIDCNLRQPLSPSALADFQRGDGQEMRDRTIGPPKMRSLLSSAALVANVFDRWNARNAVPLLHALGIDSTLELLSFEAPFPTGLPGTPPNLDVALALSPGSIVGIESKFTEWLTPKHGNKPVFRKKYFDDPELWARRGLPRCQKLATELMNGDGRFRFLDAPQLLRQMLGLATQRPGQFMFRYIYFDTPCPASTAHRGEVVRFAERIGAETDFSAMTYQELYRALRATPDVDPGYLEYLGARYFDPA